MGRRVKKFEVTRDMWDKSVETCKQLTMLCDSLGDATNLEYRNVNKRLNDLEAKAGSARNKEMPTPNCNPYGFAVGGYFAQGARVETYTYVKYVSPIIKLKNSLMGIIKYATRHMWGIVYVTVSTDTSFEIEIMDRYGSKRIIKIDVTYGKYMMEFTKRNGAQVTEVFDDLPAATASITAVVMYYAMDRKL